MVGGALRNFSKHSTRTSWCGGAKERDDSDTPPPEGEELGLGEDQMVGREENVIREQSKLCFIAFFVFILLFNLI